MTALVALGHGCAEQSDGAIAEPDTGDRGGSTSSGGGGSGGKGGSSTTGKGGSTAGKGGSSGSTGTGGSNEGGSAQNTDGGVGGDVGVGGDIGSGGVPGEGGAGGTGGITSDCGSGGAPADSGFTVKYKVDQPDSTPDIRADIWILNESGSSVDLGQLKLRYYFTNEASAGTPEQGMVNYANKAPISGGSNQPLGGMTVDVTPITEESCDADAVATINLAGGTLANGERVELRFQIHNNDSINFIQTDDYSFNGTYTAAGGTDWDHVVLSQGAAILWGVGP